MSLQSKFFSLNTLFIAIIATQAAQAADTVTLPTTTVWGTKVISDVSALDGKDIAVRQADHLSDLLRDIPGVEVGGAHSVNQRINIRGLDDTDLNITLDGANQNTFMYHHMGNLLFNADILKSIDTRVGTNSVVRGGLGGSVVMETKDPSDLLDAGKSVGARLNVNGATNKLLGGSVTVYGKAESGFDAMLYTTLVDRDNPQDGSGQETIGNDGKIKNTLLKVGKTFANDARVELSYDTYRDKGDYLSRPDMGVRTNLAIDNAAVNPTEYTRDTLALNAELPVSDSLLVKAHASKNTLDLERTQTRGGTATTTRGEANNNRVYLQAESDTKSGRIGHSFTYGVDVLSQEGISYTNGARRSREKSSNVAFYLEDRIQLTPVFSVTPGLRWDNYSLKREAGQRGFDQLSGALALEGAFENGFTARLSAAQLFKGPEQAEVFIHQAGRTVANPDIKPETGLNTELSLQYKQNNVLGADKFSVKLTGYRTLIEDAITDVDYPNDALTGRNAPVWFVNNGDLELKGAELSAHYKVGQVGFNLGYATSDSEFKQTGEPLSREIGDKLVLGVDYALPSAGMMLNLTGIHLFKENDTTSGEPKAAYTVANVSANWQPVTMPAVNLRLAVDNLFDEQYVSHASRTGNANHPVFGALNLNDYEPGRNIKLSASYKF